MNRKEKITLGVVVMIFLIVMIAVFWDYVKYYLHKGEEKITGKTETKPDSAPGVTPGKLNGDKVLKSGVYNSEEVRALQHLLNMIEPTNPLVEDGDFGPKTEKKLKKYNGGSGSITLNQAIAKIQAALNGLYGTGTTTATDPIFQNILNNLN